MGDHGDPRVSAARLANPVSFSRAIIILLSHSSYCRLGGDPTALQLQTFARWAVRLCGPDLVMMNLIINGLTIYRVNPQTDSELVVAIEDLGLT